MATINTSCPKCKKQFQVPGEIAGKKIRCKNCGNAFVATSTSVRPTDSRPEGQAKLQSGKRHADDDLDDDGKPYGITEEDLTPRCPHCTAEMEDEDAVVCLHCGYNKQTRELGKTTVIKHLTGFDHFLWLLPGILCAALFLFAPGLWFVAWFLVLACTFWAIGDMVSDNPPMIRALVGCPSLWCSVLCIYTMYKSARYAIKRLIINNKPPEEEIRK
jgi:DNA-directed RNA polymerase subunit RPC12/RpoP